ncbi:MAG: DUF4974 domain-containing protein [Caldithrix sp.]|nr:MAG: DUF4974 domain-containing protein [Caldithrix sp.]
MEESSQSTFDRIAKFLSRKSVEPDIPPPDDVPNATLEELQQIWDLAGKVKAPDAPKEMWHRLQGKMHAAERRPASVRALRPRQKKRPRFTYYALRLAAALLIAMTSYWIVDQALLGRTTVLVHNGETRTVDLPDGSRVEINSGSKLVYWRGSRKVELEGEAFFQVEPSREPFSVSAGEAKVVVLGTAFNVRARKSRVTVVVDHGTVSLESVHIGDKVKLQAGEMSRMEKGRSPTPAMTVDIGRFLAWREGRLVFERTPITEVFDELRRKFDVVFDFADFDPGERTLTASFAPDKSLQEILFAICLTAGCQFEESDGRFQIR